MLLGATPHTAILLRGASEGQVSFHTDDGTEPSYICSLPIDNTDPGFTQFLHTRYLTDLFIFHVIGAK